MEWFLIYFICSLHTYFHYGLLRLLYGGMGLTASVNGQQRIITPPRHIIPPLVFPEVCICPRLIFVLYFCGIYEIDSPVRYLQGFFTVEMKFSWKIRALWILNLFEKSCFRQSYSTIFAYSVMTNPSGSYSLKKSPNP